MKLAALYGCFNGLELLEKSIEQIYDDVDLIIIAYQEVSNKGQIKTDVKPFMERFTAEKFKVIQFIPDLSLSTKENEQRKLQLRIDEAKRYDCSHFFSSAEDHFYIPKEFKRAKKIIFQEVAYDVTLTAMYTYYKDPTWQLTPIEDYYMPFICKLYPGTKVGRNPNYPLRIDPSIQINTCNNWRLFTQSEIMMHHYSMIRVDIQNKFQNAGASIRWSPEDVTRFIYEYNNYDIEANPGVGYFQKRKIKVVPDHFGLLPSIAAT